jgi:hypothetical protein
LIYIPAHIYDTYISFPSHQRCFWSLLNERNKLESSQKKMSMFT